MQCWCKTNGDEKANSIQEAQNHIKVCHGRREQKNPEDETVPFQIGMFFLDGNAVDGRNPASVEVGSLSHFLQGFIHPTGGCLGFSSISSII